MKPEAINIVLDNNGTETELTNPIFLALKDENRLTERTALSTDSIKYWSLIK